MQPPSPEAIPVQEEWPTLPRSGKSIGECFPGPLPYPTVVLLTLSDLHTLVPSPILQLVLLSLKKPSPYRKSSPLSKFL